MPIQRQLRKYIKILSGAKDYFCRREYSQEMDYSIAVIHILFPSPKGLSDSSSFKGAHGFKENHFVC